MKRENSHNASSVGTQRPRWRSADPSTNSRRICSNTSPFKSPCPASDSKPWPPEIEYFLDNSMTTRSPRWLRLALILTNSKPWPPEIESFLGNSISEMAQISSDSDNLMDSSEQDGLFSLI